VFDHANRSDAYFALLLYGNATFYGVQGQLRPALDRDVKLPQQSLEGVRRTDLAITRGGEEAQRSSPATPRWVGSKLRFAFCWYSSLLKR
jgi:hypothetical protein